MRFVLIEQIIPESAAGRIENDRATVRRLVLAEFVQHVEHTEHGARRLAAGIAERRQRVERAIKIRRAVDENQFSRTHALTGSAARAAVQGWASKECPG